MSLDKYQSGLTRFPQKHHRYCDVRRTDPAKTNVHQLIRENAKVDEPTLAQPAGKLGNFSEERGRRIEVI